MVIVMFLKIGHWGQGGNKSLTDLIKEIMRRESYLRIDNRGISRIVRMVKMRIIRDGQLLIEDRQIFPDGCERKVSRIPGGKISSHELPQEALIREMREELYCEKQQFRFSTKGVQLQEKQSISYPSLLTVYEMHTFDVVLDPQVVIPDNFQTKDENGTHLFFKWVSAESFLRKHG
jgi:ADP-ribose pyrophosphatase YjhB (NUDIX family)